MNTQLQKFLFTLIIFLGNCVCVCKMRDIDSRQVCHSVHVKVRAQLICFHFA